MTKKNESQLHMFDAVAAYCNANTAIISTVPAFLAAFNSFQATVNGIHSAAQSQANVITGITADKAQLKEQLADSSAKMGATIFAYASNVNNNALKEQVNFTPSELGIMKDEKLVASSSNIRNAANANLAALADYGITSVGVNDFQALIDSYVALISSPRNAMSQRSSYGKTLVTLFAQANDALKTQLDKMALQFRSSNKDFYNTYKSNRLIIDPGTSTTQISGNITNAADDEPVEDATVQLVGSDLSTVTDVDGSYSLKPIAIGMQSVKIIKAGFVDDTISNIFVKLGKTTVADAAINAIAA